MRQETIYTFAELSEEAQKYAIERWRETNHEIFWQEEILDSLKAVFSTANIKLKNYELGIWGHSFVEIEMEDGVADLKGARALGWLENNLFSKLRITRAQWLENRKNYLRYGREYRQGKVKPCPLTGVYCDEAYLDRLVKEIKSGRDLCWAFKEMARVYVELLTAEYEEQNSDKYIADYLIANGYEFTVSGRRF